MRIKAFSWLLLLIGTFVILAGCSASNDVASSQNSAPAYGGTSSSGQGRGESPPISPTVSMDQAIYADELTSLPEEDNGKIVPTSGNAGTAPLDAGLNRKLIYNANVTMEVQHFRDTEHGIRNITTQAGGYILEFSERNANERLGGTFVLKVPSSGFMSFLDQLEQLRHLSMERSVRAEDVTERYIDLEARLYAREVVESRLLEFMERADTSEALLQFSRELAMVQQEIEQLKGQLRYLDQNVAFSTITLHITENEPPVLTLNSGKLTLFERMKAAMLETSNRTISVFQGLLVLFSGALPILLIVVVIGAPLSYLLRRGNKGGKKDNIDPPSTPN